MILKSRMLNHILFFWYSKSSSFFSRCAAPFFYVFLGFFSWVYVLGGFLKKRRVRPVFLKIPVICVGNVNVGGTGKTPTCLALWDVLSEISKESTGHFLTRGYKGYLKGPVEVDLKVHKSDAVGDEPLLLAQKSKTWVSKSRKAGGLEAQKRGAGHIIMDDGLQNEELHKDLSLIVVDGHFGFGNQHVFPLGPLRESLKKALQRAQGIVLIGEDLYGVQSLLSSLAPSLPLIKAHLRPSLQSKRMLQGKKVVGFAGIGFPEKFYKTLEGMEAEILGFYSFPDHYVYKKEDLEKLYHAAQESGSILVTTQKDYVRLPFWFQKKVHGVSVALDFENKESLVQLLKERIYGNSFF